MLRGSRINLYTHSHDMNASPEIKQLVDSLSDDATATTAQLKYLSILKRKRYEHDCFMQCVVLRLETRRGAQTLHSVQASADKNFEKMLSHL